MAPCMGQSITFSGLKWPQTLNWGSAPQTLNTKMCTVDCRKKKNTRTLSTPELQVEILTMTESVITHFGVFSKSKTVRCKLHSQHPCKCWPTVPPAGWDLLCSSWMWTLTLTEASFQAPWRTLISSAGAHLNAPLKRLQYLNTSEVFSISSNTGVSSLQSLFRLSQRPLPEKPSPESLGPSLQQEACWLGSVVRGQQFSVAIKLGISHVQVI